MPDFKVNAEIKATQVDHAVSKALRDLAGDATRFQDTIAIFHHWLHAYGKAFVEDTMQGEWVVYSTDSKLSAEKRFDTFQQMFAYILENLDKAIE